MHEKSQAERALSDVADWMSEKKATNKWGIPRTTLNDMKLGEERKVFERCVSASGFMCHRCLFIHEFEFENSCNIFCCYLHPILEQLVKVSKSESSVVSVSISQLGRLKMHYGQCKHQGTEYTSTENISTNWQGWKMQVQICGVENVSTETGREILMQISQKNITANLRNR